ncbi:hypothetical protein EVA_05676 [gut metagenome]|uniref:Uncharacterized protein n=1 Tax=gut metagenome TaxID=749906 RepID=J9GZ75_9ZZZZ
MLYRWPYPSEQPLELLPESVEDVLPVDAQDKSFSFLSLLYSHLCGGIRHGEASLVFLGVKVSAVFQRLEGEKPVRLLGREACRMTVPLHPHRVGKKREPSTYAVRPFLQVCRPLPFPFQFLDVVGLYRGKFPAVLHPLPLQAGLQVPYALLTGRYLVLKAAVVRLQFLDFPAAKKRTHLRHDGGLCLHLDRLQPLRVDFLSGRFSASSCSALSCRTFSSSSPVCRLKSL